MELLPITSKLENIESQFTELSKAVAFIYDQLLSQAQTSNAYYLSLTLASQNQKKDISDIQETIQKSIKEQEELAEYEVRVRKY
jgi:helix-turn-helix protein